MEPIIYIDRITKKKEKEKVYGEKALKLLYGDDIISKIFGTPLMHAMGKIPFLSSMYGRWQKNPFSAKKIKPFIQDFQVDSSEFQDSVESYKTFNDFFIRKLKREVRPIAPGNNVAIIPADARYYFYQKIDKAEGFVVKGQKFDLKKLLEDEIMASRYEYGSMVMARLCPTDYHRYHFPFDCIPGNTRFINGWLYSVNPIAIKRDFQIFTQNKRTICELNSEEFGKVLFLEIGATNVGGINQTYKPFYPCPKGAEKGFFSFGASALIILFPPSSILLDKDLTDATEAGYEIKCLMGQRMGISLRKML
jgi:phosphatidylserine decarboxylase